MLTGGSAFGLAAADGVMAHLESRGIGTPTPAGPVPIVPAAVLFDLAVGSSSVRPDADAGRAAVLEAERALPCASGRVGAGTGATVGKLFGDPVDAGLGTASAQLPSGAVVGALVAVNAVGDVVGAGRLRPGRGRRSRDRRASAGRRALPRLPWPARTPRWRSSPPTPR